MFPILEMPDNVDPVVFFPKLQRWEEFLDTKWSITRKNKIFKYIVLMYDKESPFLYKVPNLLQRKVEVSKYVKLVTDPKRVPDEILAMFRGNDAKFNSMIIAYVRMHRDVKYALVKGLENMYYKDLEVILSGDSPKKPIEQTEKALETAITELLNQDNDPQLQKELQKYMEEERLDTYRPEGIADMIAEGKDPFEGEEIDSESY